MHFITPRELFLGGIFFVMEKIKIKVGSRLHILIWNWRWLNNLYFVIYHFLYFQAPGMLETQKAKKENCISHFTRHTETYWYYLWILVHSFNEHFKSLHFERKKKLNLVLCRTRHLLYPSPAKNPTLQPNMLSSF